MTKAKKPARVGTSKPASDEETLKRYLASYGCRGPGTVLRAVKKLVTEYANLQMRHDKAEERLAYAELAAREYRDAAALANKLRDAAQEASTNAVIAKREATYQLDILRHGVASLIAEAAEKDTNTPENTG